MAIIESKVIPLELMLKGQALDFRKIVEDAKKYPGHFLLELFSIAMMLVGVYVVAGWAYELVVWVGYNLG
jgi:hypothetical protein